jgi:hypothetical protein
MGFVYYKQVSVFRPPNSKVLSLRVKEAQGLKEGALYSSQWSEVTVVHCKNS